MAKPICIPWETNMDGTISCSHLTDDFELTPEEDQDMMIRHCLLEVLDMLSIIEYSRGYDGCYHDITIKRSIV